MALNSFLLSFLLHLGLQLPVTAEDISYSLEGIPVNLRCNVLVPNQNPDTVTWKRNGVEVFKYLRGNPWRVLQNDAFKGGENFDLVMTKPIEGLYTCAVSGQERSTSTRLHILKVNGSPEGYLLQGESLELQLNPPDMEPTAIEWIGPHNEKGHRKRWNLMDNNKKLQIKDLQVQDDGKWECSAHGKRIPYKVTVIGFLQARDEEIFAAINSTVTLAYELNTQNEIYLNTTEVLLTQETLGKSTSFRGRGSCSTKTIPKVQFEDGGHYQCHLRFSRGWLNKTIHLVVMKVFASPLGPLLEDGEVNVCCSLSAPLPPGALLRWNNGSESRDRDGTHCLTARKAGEWRCSLIIGEEERIGMNYTVEEATEQTGFLQMGVALGAGVPLVLILLSVCLFAYIAMKRKMRRNERRAQAKEHLLAKRTCKCQRDQSNDYYHT